MSATTGFEPRIRPLDAEVVGLVSLQLLTGAFNLVAGIDSSMAARSAA